MTNLRGARCARRIDRAGTMSLATIPAGLPMPSRATEEPDDRVIRKPGDVARRRDAAYVVAEVRAPEPAADAGSQAFPILVGYIFGKNKSGRKLTMMLAADTHPLITSRVKKHLASSVGMDDATWRAWQFQRFGTGLKAEGERLANDAQGGKFCHADMPTIADVCLASIVVMPGV